MLAYAERIDGTGAENSSPEILDGFAEVIVRARDQRDAAAAFVRPCLGQEELAEREMDRLKARRDRIRRIRSEFEQWLVAVIDRVAQPDRRGVERLEGCHSTLRLQRNPPSVAIADAEAIPLRLKDVVLTMPAYVWQGVLQCLPVEDRPAIIDQVISIEIKPDKKTIAEELKAGEHIAGAALQPGAYRLVVN